MRLAGTARQYSKKAIPQLISTISHMARCSTFSWPYQAKVMNTLETISSRTGASAVQENIGGGSPARALGGLDQAVTRPISLRQEGGPHAALGDGVGAGDGAAARRLR